MKNIRHYFQKEIASLFPGYRQREPQIDLAENIASVIEDRTTGVFEAGTGTGKTLSYLLPAFLAEGTAIISTATKNLQDQLLYKDVPILSQLFPQKRVAVLKGRANYVCPYRLRMHINTLKPVNRPQGRDAEKLDQLIRIRGWLSQTRTGDLSELLDLEEDRDVLPMVTSSRDNCLAGRCPQQSECPLYLAREKARAADVVIVNHHLLFADLAQKEESLQSLLPRADVVILDEAHHAAETARQFFGESIGSGQFLELGRDTRRELAALGNDEPLLVRAVELLEQASDQLNQLIQGSMQTDFQQWRQSADRESIENSLEKMDLCLESLTRQLERIADRSEGLAMLARRGAGLLDLFTLLTEPEAADGDYVHWIDRRERGFVIHLSPLSVASVVAPVMSRQSAWVFVSATLSVDGSFDHFIGELGLSTDIKAVFPSPFNYETSVCALVPTGLPEPADPEFTRSLVQRVIPVIRAHGGRTFMLFTSHRALGEAAEALAGFERQVLVQGSMSRSRLMDVFREVEGCVLLATQSFWEGVDARGADLRCLIIDKLPFPSPAEPVFSALARSMELNGRNAFDELSLPRAALSLKQGFGRLIREETDHGVFILGDPRLHTRRYGAQLIANLPVMNWTRNTAEAIAWFKDV